MAIDKPQAHRSGSLKQVNKEHKHGRHRSKGSISVATKGKVSVKTISKRLKNALNKDQRRHQALQIRQKKRDEVLSKKRSLGGLDYAPFLVCLLPLHEDIDPTTAINILMQCDPEAEVNKSPTGVTHILLPRFKQHFSFIIPPKDDLAILDSLKVCDTVLFLISAATSNDLEESIDDWGNNILMSAFAQGLPTPVVAVTDLESIVPKKRHDCKQNIQKLIAKWLPEEKVVTLDTNSDGINILRKIGNQKRKSVVFRDRRAHLYAENIEFVPDSQGTMGTLKVTGYLRGAALSVNGLVHLPGLGDFQMLQIDSPPDPNMTERKNKSANAMDSGSSEVIKILEKSDVSKQETLDSENVPDPMDAEQTWPTNEEIEMAEQEQKAKKVKRVPKGWSAYQAAWIPDEDAEFGSDEDDSEEGSDDFMDAASEDNSQASEDEGEQEEFDTITESEVAVNDEKYDQEMDLQAERQALEKLKAAKSDRMFPDEVDTPVDQSARIRFQKYRGLESFRTSPWDPKENLPTDYARIFQFENFDRTKKRVLHEQKDVDGVLPGWYITVHVKEVSQLRWEAFKQSGLPLILIGLFPYEHKMSVLNAVLKRTANYNIPIKSKERVIIQCGYRRFVVCPVYSQHTNGQKHKFERFFQPESTSVATFYAPIQFPPAPVLCYKEVNSKLILVATGSLLSCNPDRLIIKRVVLSGHPLKIHKRSAVIRFMFFNREDIAYFKPCKLRTKMGRSGHIKEPLGTHGHMKCVFDGQLKSQDTVLLNLYKRVFPKWTYEDLVVSCDTNNENMDL